MKVLGFLILFLIPTMSFSWVSTARVLKSSSDSKLFLLNMGQEDGMEMMTNAIFYDDFGKRVRAEIIRISPSRSIWQIHRVYRDELLKENRAYRFETVSQIRVTPEVFIQDKIQNK